MRAEEQQINENNARHLWTAIKAVLKWYMIFKPHTIASKIIEVIFEVLVKNDRELNDFRERSL